MWTFSKPDPVRLDVSAGQTATVQYTITNQSVKAKDLILKAPLGVSASSCHLAQKSSTCVLSLVIDGSKVPKSGLHSGPVLCEKGNAHQCYQPARGNELNVSLRQKPASATTVAVGQVYVGDETAPVVGPISYYSEDNGLSWTIANMPFTDGEETYYPQGVSCNHNNLCVQVGVFSGISSFETVDFYSVDHGKNWQGPVNIADNVGLAGVSCNDQGICVAIGGDAALPLAYFSMDQGKSWAVSDPLPLKSANPHILLAVSCLSEKCVAVGNYQDNVSNEQVLSYYSLDNGKSWQLSAITAPSSQISALSGVSCLSNGACVAVGRQQLDPFSPNQPLSYYSSDKGQTWLLSPGTPSLLDAVFVGVSCNAQACSVSGAMGSDSQFYSYYSMDQGKNWLPSVSSGLGVLNTAGANIFCSSAQFCNAVGVFISSDTPPTPFSHYSNDNGKHWSDVFAWPLPEGAFGGLLFSVS